jgi:hypothetical protein
MVPVTDGGSAFTNLLLARWLSTSGNVRSGGVPPSTPASAGAASGSLTTGAPAPDDADGADVDDADEDTVDAASSTALIATSPLDGCRTRAFLFRTALHPFDPPYVGEPTPVEHRSDAEIATEAQAYPIGQACQPHR